MSRGYVYVLTNEYMPGLVKIGMTRGEPEARAKQLSTTGVPADFEVYGSVYTFDAEAFEGIVHESLSEYRVNQSREFFRLEKEDALQKITQIHVEVFRDIVSEFLETYELVEYPYFVDPSVIFQKANDLDAEPHEISGAIDEMDSEDMRPALEKYRQRLASRKSKIGVLQ